MISSNDFNLAIDLLHRVVQPEKCLPFQGRFSAEYEDQGVIATALKIIHRAVGNGSSEQKKELSQCRREIIALNSLLSHHQMAEKVRSSLGIEIEEKLDDMQIAVPQTAFDKMVETALLVPQAIASILIEILLLPAAGILLLFMLAAPSFDPQNPKKDAIPILLLHGSGFNESEWILGRQFLKKENYGSVFSLNYDGLASNDPKKGIDDYAADKIRAKILQIKQLTGQNRIILIGHSMGGMIGGYYAERFADQDGVQIEHVISVSSPWQGSPAVDRFMAGPDAPKRYNQMSSENPFRKDLVAASLHSERKGLRNYYSIGSKTDFIVPGPTGILTEDPRRQLILSSVGHYGIIAAPSVWLQIRSWLDAIYEKERHINPRQNVLVKSISHSSV